MTTPDTSPAAIPPALSIPPVPSPVPPDPGPGPGVDDRASLVERLTTGRPANFPSVGGWLKVGIFRDWRGTVTALIAAWFYLPAAVATAVAFALYVAIAWLFNSIFGELIGSETPGEEFAQVPIMGDALGNLVSRSGGVVLVLVGVILGAVLGFIGGLIVVFAGPFQEGVLQGASTVVGALVGGVVTGLLYTVYRVTCEGWLLRVTGARRLSRREADLLLPIVRDCAARLGLPNHPLVLIDDSRDANALAYTRHIVINQGLLEEFNYDREVIAGVICHELVHWRNGDSITDAFVRGIALPLYLIQAGAGWLLQRAGSSMMVRFVIWFAFWPVFVTVRYLVMPMLAADARRAEYRADQGAVLAGHRAGMRRVLTRLRQSFEGGRNGWVAAICATHPPNELRLERLEEPGGQYPLPDDEAPPLPIPVTMSPQV